MKIRGKNQVLRALLRNYVDPSDPKSVKIGLYGEIITIDSPNYTEKDLQYSFNKLMEADIHGK